MAKTVNFKISDELYYSIAEVKAKNSIGSWKGLFEWIVQKEKEQ